MERYFKGVWIPKEVYLDKKLSWFEKILLVEIWNLDNDNGCFASNEYFAEFLGVTTVHISRSISHLKDEGYLISEFIDNKRILRAFNKNVKVLLTDGLTAINKNVKHIYKDTKDNIINNINKDQTLFDLESHETVYHDFIRRFNQLRKSRFGTKDKGAQNALLEIIRQKYTVDDILKALKSAMQSEYHKSNNFCYLTPEFITRRDKFEMYFNSELKQKTDSDYE